MLDIPVEVLVVPEFTLEFSELLVRVGPVSLQHQLGFLIEAHRHVEDTMPSLHQPEARGESGKDILLAPGVVQRLYGRLAHAHALAERRLDHGHVPGFQYVMTGQDDVGKIRCFGRY